LPFAEIVITRTENRQPAESGLQDMLLRAAFHAFQTENAIAVQNPPFSPLLVWPGEVRGTHPRTDATSRASDRIFLQVRQRKPIEANDAHDRPQWAKPTPESPRRKRSHYEHTKESHTQRTHHPADRAKPVNHEKILAFALNQRDQLSRRTYLAVRAKKSGVVFVKLRTRPADDQGDEKRCREKPVSQTSKHPASAFRKRYPPQPQAASQLCQQVLKEAERTNPAAPQSSSKNSEGYEEKRWLDETPIIVTAVPRSDHLKVVQIASGDVLSVLARKRRQRRLNTEDLQPAYAPHAQINQADQHAALHEESQSRNAIYSQVLPPVRLGQGSLPEGRLLFYRIVISTMRTSCIPSSSRPTVVGSYRGKTTLSIILRWPKLMLT